MRLLIVEDDPQISRVLQKSLERSGYAVDGAADARSATSALRTQSYDLVVLDLGLPDADGFSVLEELRRGGAHVPVLILTARDEPRDRVRGLNLGADDYVVKPFDSEELQARIRAILRRAAGVAADDIRCGAVSLALAERRVRLHGSRIEMSRRELELLEVLLMRQGQIVSKDRIQQHLCRWDEDLSENAIEIYVHRLRRKLDGGGVVIRTVRGFGYLLEAERA